MKAGHDKFQDLINAPRIKNVRDQHLLTFNKFQFKHTLHLQAVLHISSLQCYSVLSDIWVKIKLCIPLESESSVLSTCNAFACLSPPSKLKFAVLFCSICKGLISFSAILLI